MKSDYIFYDSHFERGETNKGHYENIARAKLINAIIDLAEDVKKLNSRIQKLELK